MSTFFTHSPVIPKDQRPRDTEYALFSQYAYQDRWAPEMPIPEGEEWVVHATKKGRLGYFGLLLRNDKTHQFVLAHRGTNSVKAVIEDVWGVVQHGVSPQKESAFEFTELAVHLAKAKGYQLSFTGHSLGAYLAELSVYFCHRSFQHPFVNAVTFESPGVRESIEKLESNLRGIELESLDIFGYVDYPNLINTCNRHLGTLVPLDADLGRFGNLPGWYVMQCHSMKKVAEALALLRGKSRYLIDWPVGLQREKYFQYAEWEHHRYHLSEQPDVKTLFELTYKAHHQLISEYGLPHALPLRHFQGVLKEFLQKFYKSFWDIGYSRKDRELIIQQLYDLPVSALLKKYLPVMKIHELPHDVILVLDATCYPEGDLREFRQALATAFHEDPRQLRALLRIAKMPNLPVPEFGIGSTNDRCGRFAQEISDLPYSPPPKNPPLIL